MDIYKINLWASIFISKKLLFLNLCVFRGRYLVVFLFACTCVHLLRAFLRYALRAALTYIQNAPDILVRKKRNQSAGAHVYSCSLYKFNHQEPAGLW